MKLSKAQERVMQDAKQKIDNARACETFEEYFTKYIAPYNNGAWKTIESYQTKDPEALSHYIQFWNNEKDGIVLCEADSRTIRKLEEFGLIKIIYDSVGESYGIDTIKVLNY